jgi:hypothetical protein
VRVCAWKINSALPVLRLASYALHALPSMSSNSGDLARQPGFLNADANASVDQLSDVGSFSRTRPDVDDDEDDLDTSPPPEEVDGDDDAQLGLASPAHRSNVDLGRIASADADVDVQVSTVLAELSKLTSTGVDCIIASRIIKAIHLALTSTWIFASI